MRRPEDHARARKPTTARTEHIGRALHCVRRVVRALRVAEQRTQAETGVSAAQLYVLRQLESSAAESLSELARRTLTDRSSVADVVDRLAARNLVRRAPGSDKRRTSIVITASGRILLRRAPAGPTSLLVSALEELDDATLAGLANGLVHLTEVMRTDDTPTAQAMMAEQVRPRSPRIARRATRDSAAD